MALIRSEDVPQADILDDVVRAVEAVARGVRTYQGIARTLNKVERQGRYYRRAAEILGFIENSPGTNNARLTHFGREFIHAPAERRSDLLTRAVLGSAMIQRVIPFLESHELVGRKNPSTFIETLTERTGPSMIPRRANSVVGWLVRIGMLQQEGERFRFVAQLPRGIAFLEYSAPEEPLLPRGHELTEYSDVARRVLNAQGEIKSLISVAARERANDSHKMLTNLVASKIRTAGGVPKRNKFVDLAARIGEQDFIFEMKSSTDQNVHVQIRTGLSQLYEYKYLQKAIDAQLVLVIEHPVPRASEWIVDYLISDRSVLLAWDGDGRSIRCPHEIRPRLKFLT